MITQTIHALRNVLAKRSRYARMVAEIEGLSERDLSDLRADRAEMLYQAYQEVYGKR